MQAVYEDQPNRTRMSRPDRQLQAMTNGSLAAFCLNLPLRFSPWMTGHARGSLGGSRDIRFAA